MGTPQEGWLECDCVHEAAAPVDLVSFNGWGIGVVLKAGYPVLRAMHAMLTTPMHGGGCIHRPVDCHWQRLHPHDPQLQCMGLHFDIGDEDVQ